MKEHDDLVVPDPFLGGIDVEAELRKRQRDEMASDIFMLIVEHHIDRQDTGSLFSTAREDTHANESLAVITARNCIYLANAFIAETSQEVPPIKTS